MGLAASGRLWKVILQWVKSWCVSNVDAAWTALLSVDNVVVFGLLSSDANGVAGDLTATGRGHSELFQLQQGRCECGVFLHCWHFCVVAGVPDLKLENLLVDRNRDWHMLSLGSVVAGDLLNCSAGSSVLVDAVAGAAARARAETGEAETVEEERLGLWLLKMKGGF
ncbi:hypothetical protein MLD38_037472 [Melastoma candidum]|uniref:Uncharacterized protein n=1 Tax=Melastoma candidum TaxID=119954 RepID=A0ACB9LMU2_9MYRT|nr:hypothetical protein MLD38_037472 [Melastoma candidum]